MRKIKTIVTAIILSLSCHCVWAQIFDNNILGKAPKEIAEILEKQHARLIDYRKTKDGEISEISAEQFYESGLNNAIPRYTSTYYFKDSKLTSVVSFFNTYRMPPGLQGYIAKLTWQSDYYDGMRYVFNDNYKTVRSIQIGQGVVTIVYTTTDELFKSLSADTRTKLELDIVQGKAREEQRKKDREQSKREEEVVARIKSKSYDLREFPQVYEQWVEGVCGEIAGKYKEEELGCQNIYAFHAISNSSPQYRCLEGSDLDCNMIKAYALYQSLPRGNIKNWVHFGTLDGLSYQKKQSLSFEAKTFIDFDSLVINVQCYEVAAAIRNNKVILKKTQPHSWGQANETVKEAIIEDLTVHGHRNIKSYKYIYVRFANHEYLFPLRNKDLYHYNRYWTGAINLNKSL